MSKTDQKEDKIVRSGVAMFGNLQIDFGYNEKGKIIYKSTNVVPFKKDGNLKAQYADLPKYDLILIYEGHTKKMFNEDVILKSVKEINSKLKSFHNNDIEKSDKHYELIPVHRGGKLFQRKQLVNNDKKNEHTLQESIDWVEDKIFDVWGFIPEYNIKIGETSSTFNKSITISKNKVEKQNKNWNTKYGKIDGDYDKFFPSPLHETIMHEIGHIFDNSFGPKSKFDESVTRQCSSEEPWIKFDLNKAPTSYGQDSRDEDFVVSFVFYTMGRGDELKEGRKQFFDQLKNKLYAKN